MARLQVLTLDRVLDTFDTNAIDHIRVNRWFDAEKFANDSLPHLSVHLEHLGTVPKSGRILEVFLVDSSKQSDMERYQSHLYNADSVILSYLK